MALPKIDLFGAPNYGRLKGKEGVVFHTPENTDQTVEAAISTAKWQATASNTSGGSYHGILGWDADLGPMSDPAAWVLVKTVPFTDIAGSISTNRDPAVWQPGRYPWIAELLSPAAYADPNAYLHALCLGGKAAWWSARLNDPARRPTVNGAIIALAKWVRRLETEFGYDAVLTLHRHWQTNRSDPDGLSFADMVLEEYQKLFQPADGGSAGGDTTQPTRAELNARIKELEDQLAAQVAANELLAKANSRLRARIMTKDGLSGEIAALAAKQKEA